MASRTTCTTSAVDRTDPMSLFQKLLLIPCLALLGLLIASGLNTGSSSQLQLLVWRTPSLPIGAWTALAGITGAGLSAASALLLLPSAPPLRRRSHQPLDTPMEQEWPQQAPAPMPERDVRDPAPTVAVPYRVVQKGRPQHRTVNPNLLPAAPQQRPTPTMTGALIRSGLVSALRADYSSGNDQDPVSDTPKQLEKPAKAPKLPNLRSPRTNRSRIHRQPVHSGGVGPVEGQGHSAGSSRACEGDRPGGGSCPMVIGELPGDRRFWLCFGSANINSPKLIALADAGSEPTLLESFLIDEKRMSLPLLVSRLLQRLNGQKWLGRN